MDVSQNTEMELKETEGDYGSADIEDTEFKESSSLDITMETKDMEFKESSLLDITMETKENDVKMDTEVVKDSEVNAANTGVENKENKEKEADIVKEDNDSQKSESLEQIDPFEKEYNDFNSYLRTCEKKLEELTKDMDKSLIEGIKRHVDMVDKLKKQDEAFQKKYDRVKNILDDTECELKNLKHYFPQKSSL